MIEGQAVILQSPSAVTRGTLQLLDEQGTSVAEVPVHLVWSMAGSGGFAGELLALYPLEHGSYRAWRRAMSRTVPDGAMLGTNVHKLSCSQKA